MIQSGTLQTKFQRRMEKFKGFLLSESHISPIQDNDIRKTKTPLMTQQPSSDISDHENVEHNQIGLKSMSFLDQYTLGMKLGEGTNGIVHLCWPKDQEANKFAVKIIPTDDEEIINMVKQSFINSTLLKSPFIARCYKLFIESCNLYLLMEWVPCQNLETLLKEKGKLAERQVQQIALTLLKAVNCLHKAGVCHRDIKPDNIQIQKDFTVKLIDFGVSRRFVTYNQNTFRYNRNKMLTITGNLHYRAPEIYRDYGYDSQIDLWAIGVVIYQCLTGYLPYHSEHMFDLVDMLSSKEPCLIPFQQACFQNLSSSSRDFIKRLMMWNPLKRLNASEALRHIWIPTYISPNKIRKQKVKDDIDVSKISQNSDLLNKTLISSAMMLDQELTNTLQRSRKFDSIKEEDTPKNTGLELSIKFDSHCNNLKKKLQQFKLSSSTHIHQRMNTNKNTIQYINTITVLDSEQNIKDSRPNIAMDTSINLKGQIINTKNIKDLFGLNLCESQVSLTQIEDLPDEQEIKCIGKSIDADLLMEVNKFEQN